MYTLTDLQFKIMSILWQRGSATASIVREELAPERQLARTTVATMLARLEKQGLVRAERQNITNVYYPLVEQGDVKSSMVDGFVNTVFQGYPLELE